MQVKLRVIGGKNDGREITISIPEFVIGRGEGAHLRPNSDLVSRRHCSIRKENRGVVIEDFKSRNGTFVNGNQIAEPQLLKQGDVVRVGRLQFEMMIDPSRPGAKKPKVEDLAEAATRAAGNFNEKNGSVNEDSITDWLAEPDDAATESLSETQQFRLDDTHLNSPIPKRESNGQEDSSAAEDSAEETVMDTDSKIRRSKKKAPGKLPDRPKVVSGNTKDAADDVLRRFFNQR